MARILIAEDDEKIAQLLATVLGQSSHEVTIADAGPAAVREAVAIKPDLIFLDIAIPAMSGIEVCERLRRASETAFTPIVVLSAHPTAENRSRALAAGANRFIAKPFSVAELTDLVAALMHEI